MRERINRFFDELEYIYCSLEVKDEYNMFYITILLCQD